LVFEERYGLLGADFIEMHYEVPVAGLSIGSILKPEQLKPLCANCHRMIHRQVPMLTITQLIRAISATRRASRSRRRGPAGCEADRQR
jgi:5-methylcytosine-specific restriction protein A